MARCPSNFVLADNLTCSEVACVDYFVDQYGNYICAPKDCATFSKLVLEDDR